jgi:hypothetical protein
MPCHSEAALFFPCRTKVVVRFGKIGRQFDRALIAADGLIERPKSLQCVAKVVMRPGEQWVQLNRATVDGNGLIQAAGSL